MIYIFGHRLTQIFWIIFVFLSFRLSALARPLRRGGRGKIGFTRLNTPEAYKSAALLSVENLTGQAQVKYAALVLSKFNGACKILWIKKKFA